MNTFEVEVDYWPDDEDSVRTIQLIIITTESAEIVRRLLSTDEVKDVRVKEVHDVNIS